MKFIPVTTFGPKYPLDDLIRPYLPRFTDTVMVSYHYARQMTRKPPLRLMVDSGGFLSRKDDARIVQVGHVFEIQLPSGERLCPREVLDFQQQTADLAFTLDFMVIDGQHPHEQRRRFEATLTNAHWASGQGSKIPLYGSLQAFDDHSAREAARLYRSWGLSGIGIGGLIPRLQDRPALFRLVEAVMEEAHGLPVHAFGLGDPKALTELAKMGVATSDSSSFVQYAAAGRTFEQQVPKGTLSPHGRMRLALDNLRTLVEQLGHVVC